MKGVIYCRVSSKEQVEGTSLESQEVACREYAQSKNIEVLQAFIEEGESAKFADRTRLLELIDFCRRNKGSVDVLIVWKVDRFARNVADHFNIKTVLAKFGVRIASVTEPIDTNPEGKLMETILAGFAQFDNDIRAMRTMQGMRRKLREGIWPWRPPLGYKSPVAGHEKKNIPDAPDEPAFGILKRAFAEFATGAHSQNQVNRLMNQWGLVATRGRPLAPQSLYGLFTNPYYTGILVDPWSGEELPGKHPPLVSRQNFARVQQVVNANRRPTPHQTARDEFPLRGLVRCEGCGHNLTGAFSTGRSRRYPYYRCTFHGCARRGRSIPCAELHNEYMGFLDEIAPRTGLLGEIGEAVIRAAIDGHRELLERRKSQQSRLVQLEAQIAELIRMRSQLLIGDEEFLREKEKLTKQRHAIETRLPENLDPSRLRQALGQILEPLTNLRRTWVNLEPQVRTRFNRLILPGGFVIGRLRTADRGLLFSTFCSFPKAESGKVPFTFMTANQLMAEISEFSKALCGTAYTNEDE